MSLLNRLTAVLAIAAMLGPMTPLEARTRKGDRYLADGRQHEGRKEWDAALEAYEKALSEDPADVSYQMAAQKARFQDGQLHVDNGLKVRAAGQLGDALTEFQKAFAANPGSTIAVQQIQLTQQMIERERKRVEETGREASATERGLTPVQVAKREEADKIDRILPVPELRPTNAKAIDLKMNNQPVKVLFDTLGKYVGINVLWDVDYQAPPAPKDKLSVEIENSTIEEALDYLAIQTKMFWKPLSANTIFVTNDNLNKRRDFEDQVSRVFYLSNATTAQELNDVITSARTVSDCTKMYPNNAQFAIVAKCSADQMTLAEKIIHDLDKPKAEVVVDILVLEASTVFSRALNTALIANGLNLAAGFSPRSSIQSQLPSTTGSTTTSSTTSSNTSTTSNTGTSTSGSTSTTAGTSIPIANLGHLSSADWAVTLPGALLQATLSDTGTKILQAPQLRSVDGAKASLKIGDREPTATGSFQPGIGGVGINPLVNTQFQYIDVGVNVEMTPRVHDNGEISMEISLEISSVDGTVNLSGIEQPIIGQRKVQHFIRMREGEVSLLAGLVQSQETKKLSGIPGLSSVPLLGRLFTVRSTDRNRDELMIAIVPHIVRAPEITAENLRTVSVGNQAMTSLHLRPRRPAEPEKETPLAAQPAAGARPLVTAAPPATMPPAVTAPPATAPLAANPPLNAATAPGPATAVPAPGGLPATAPPDTPLPPSGQTPQPPARSSIVVVPAQVSTSLSGTFTIAVQIDSGSDIASAPMQISFDPKALRLDNVNPGNLLSKGGQQPVFTRNIMNDTGTAAIQLNLTPGTPGVSGPGTLVTMVFQAVARGSSIITLPGMMVTNSQGQVVATGTPQVIVDVK